MPPTTMAETGAEIRGAEPILLSALNHYSYCPRRCYLIHAESEYEHNIHTARGVAEHACVDIDRYETGFGRRLVTGLPLWSERIGLLGKADLVEFSADGVPYPVEYKHGARKKWLNDDLQLAAQALCLEEMTGKPVAKGAIYHHSSRRRREVVIDAALRALVLQTAAAVRDLLAGGQIPAPLNDARCKECSLKDRCQPEVMTARDRQAHWRKLLFRVDDPCTNC